jgi:hypothetical protein
MTDRPHDGDARRATRIGLVAEQRDDIASWKLPPRGVPDSITMRTFAEVDVRR